MSSKRSLALKFQLPMEECPVVAFEEALATVALLFLHCALVPASVLAAVAMAVRGLAEVRPEPECIDGGPEGG
jgi:hypothetical protein